MVSVDSGENYERSMKAEQLIERARNAISSIRRQHLNELRALRLPHEIIYEIFKAMLILHGEEDDYSWNNQQRMLSDPSFLSRLTEWDLSKKISQETLNKIYPIIFENELTENKVMASSYATGYAYVWLHCLIELQELIPEPRAL